ncbi:nucleoside-specific channel-forming Tsx family protein [Prevotella ihumii]|uniref:nucleoside-specific channel-forming Tsx family protein n=1 Tax=Prevotella ihumii TaxID=1917878 RepID=UPI0009810517|nr:DUF5020 family protein [Prevotella ihumii]
MKKFLSLAIFSMAAFAGVQAQNVQVHYDLGKTMYDDLNSRPALTTTVEMFKPDSWGSTFLFTDIDYKNDGTVGAYWEIAREFNLTKNKQWAAHVEYNGGVGTGELPEGYYGNRYQHAFLAGGAWNWANSDFSKTFSVQLMYKYYFKNGHTGARPFSGFQLTEVWGLQLAKGLCSFNGFCDLWYDPNCNGKLILLSEPQFWVNMNKLKGMDKVNLSLGTEVEISNNFVWNNKAQHNKFYAIPTIAAKWTF